MFGLTAVLLAGCGASRSAAPATTPVPETTQPTVPGRIDELATQLFEVIGLSRQAWVLLADDEMGNPPAIDPAAEEQIAGWFTTAAEKRIAFDRVARELDAAESVQLVNETWESCVNGLRSSEDDGERADDLDCQDIEDQAELAACDAERAEYEELEAAQRLDDAQGRAVCIEQLAQSMRDGLDEVLSAEAERDGERARAAACTGARVRAFDAWDRQAQDMARAVEWAFNSTESLSMELGSSGSSLVRGIELARRFEDAMIRDAHGALLGGMPDLQDAFNQYMGITTSDEVPEIADLLTQRVMDLDDAVSSMDTEQALTFVREVITLATQLVGEIDRTEAAMARVIEATSELRGAVQAGRDGLAADMARSAARLSDLRTAIEHARAIAATPELAAPCLGSLAADLASITEEWLDVTELETTTDEVVQTCRSPTPGAAAPRLY